MNYLRSQTMVDFEKRLDLSEELEAVSKVDFPLGYVATEIGDDGLSYA
ncbi:hypothetical protein [Pseudaestuariivita rosea]|nr:hypothetical protein [Pseudaestuariivita rosea]